MSNIFLFTILFTNNPSSIIEKTTLIFSIEKALKNQWRYYTVKEIAGNRPANPVTTAGVFHVFY